MALNIIASGFIILLLSLSINSSPPRDTFDDHNEEIVGQATNILTAKLLKGGIENNKNSVFSPIGFATILAILGDGASDDTNHDIIALLKHPKDRATVRAAYRSALTHLQGTDPQTAPQFRSWFYIYKNNSVDESYRRILVDDYFVTVRDVEPYNPDEFLFAAPPSDHKTLAHDEGELYDVQLKSNVQSIVNNSKDIVEFDSFKKESEPIDETRIDTQKDASKFDEVVEDRQYVEVPVIKDNMKAEPAVLVNSVDGNKPADHLTAASYAAEPERIKLPLRHYEEMEIMRAEESRYGKSFGDKSGDGASIISGNSIVGEKENASENDTEKYEPKMLLFNGLYYRGNWATPFQHLRDGIGNVFYADDNEKIPIKMMRSCGYYRIGGVEKYASDAIEFPYDNSRYSMLVIVPKARDGLKELINNFNANTISEFSNALEEIFLDVSLPKFEVETTSGAEKTLSKEGLASLFTSKADFSGITNTQKLRIGELQQHVTMRVDEASSAENFLSATSTLRNNAPVDREFVVDRPFLFFVRDRIDDVLIVAGKIVSLNAFEMLEPEIPY